MTENKIGNEERRGVVIKGELFGVECIGEPRFQMKKQKECAN